MPRPTLVTEPLEVTDTGHLTELLYDDGGDAVLVCAPHGGRVEPGTAEAAVELATRLPAATCWARLGFDAAREEFDVYHPASTAVDPDDHPLLAEISDRGFGTVLALHGLADEGVLVGGAVAEDAKRRAVDRLDAALAAEVSLAVPGGPYGGVSDENVVNWLAADGAGLQVECGPTVRGEEADALVGALAGLVEDGAV